MQVPLDGGVFAVDFEGVQGLVAAGVAGGLEQAERAVGEVAEEGAGVVDGDGLGFSGEVVRAFLDEGFGHRGDGRGSAVEPEGGVDAVGQQVAGDAAAGFGGVEPPERRAALGQVGGDRPVLEEVGAVVEDAAELAFVDELLGQRDGGDAAVVVPDHVRDAGVLDGRGTSLRLRRRSWPAAFRRGPFCPPRRRRWRSRRAGYWGRRCRPRRCRRARPGRASRSRWIVAPVVGEFLRVGAGCGRRRPSSSGR